MREFLFDIFIDELIGLLPRPLRIAFWSLLGGSVIALLLWLMLR